MTQEEKQLLLVDLCGRLPYGVKTYYKTAGWEDKYCTIFPQVIDNMLHRSDVIVKPYLRPLSSMTEEEKRELQSFFPGSFGSQWLNLEEGYIDIYECESTTRLYLYDSRRLIEWLNKKMFDFRGLIDEGLAISTITYWMPMPQPPVLSNSENIGKDEKGGEV